MEYEKERQEWKEKRKTGRRKEGKQSHIDRAGATSSCRTASLRATMDHLSASPLFIRLALTIPLGASGQSDTLSHFDWL